MVPLDALGTLHRENGPRQITRFNKMLSAEVNAQSTPGTGSGRFMDLVGETELPSGYHIEWTGMSLQEQQNSGRLAVLLGLAVLFAWLFLTG